MPQLLKSAGAAIALLTNSSRSTELLSEENENGVDARKAAFLKHVRNYYTTLNQVQSTLMKQTTALEDAGILPRDVPRAEDGITNSGLGGLDTAWLNSRSRDVGLDKERELVKATKQWLDKNGNNSMKD